jgi:hypothetical protein
MVLPNAVLCPGEDEGFGASCPAVWGRAMPHGLVFGVEGNLGESWQGSHVKDECQGLMVAEAWGCESADPPGAGLHICPWPGLFSFLELGFPSVHSRSVSALVMYTCM